MKDFTPYPVNALPEPIRGFASRASAAIGCCPSFVALPLLSMLAAAIGNSRCLILKTGYAVPSILWTVIVGESGTAKSPAFKAALRPIEDRQRVSFDHYQHAMERHKRDRAEWKQEFNAWKEQGSPGSPPNEQSEPVLSRCKVQDTTVEALAPLLLSNPRGLLLARDELSGWLGSFDQYSKGKGADSAHWLSMYDGASLTVDRKTSTPPVIYVPSAAISITGGIQPAILRKALRSEHRDNGLAARLLLTFPPSRVCPWTEEGIDPADEQRLAKIVDRLFDLQPTIGNYNRPQPVPLGMAKSARRQWIDFHDEHAKEMNKLTGDLRAAYNKIKESPARLALVLHLAQWAGGNDQELPGTIGAESMRAGIILARWHANEARRVYAMLDGDPDQQNLIDWIAKRGGGVTPREVQQGRREIKTAHDAESALQSLIDAGHGAWEDLTSTPTGGRPTRLFRLTTTTTVNKTHEANGENESCVDVDRVTAESPVAGQPDEWEVA